MRRDFDQFRRLQAREKKLEDLRAKYQIIVDGKDYAVPALPLDAPISNNR